MKAVAKKLSNTPRVQASASDKPGAKNAINAAVGLFNRRWVLRVLWELRAEPLTFRGLQTACGDLSPTVLNARLAELRDAQLVSHTPSVGYALTEMGEELLVAMKPLMAWAIRWQRTVKTQALRHELQPPA